MLLRAAAIALLALGAAWASSAAPPSSISGFHHDPKSDVWGMYWPAHPVRAGKWQLGDVRIGTEDEFVKYEAERARQPIDAPVSLDFDDATSPMIHVRTRLQHARTHWVPASAYRIDGTTVRFAADDPVVGRITFDGTAHFSIPPSQRRADDTEEPVLTGTLTIGTRTFKDIAFTWSGFGD